MVKQNGAINQNGTTEQSGTKVQNGMGEHCHISKRRVTVKQNGITEHVSTDQSDTMKLSCTRVKIYKKEHNGLKIQSVTIDHCTTKDQCKTIVQSDTMKQCFTKDQTEIMKLSNNIGQSDTVEQNRAIEQSAIMEQNETTEQSATLEQNYTSERGVTVEQNNTTEKSVTMEQDKTTEQSVTLVQNESTEERVIMEQNNTMKQNACMEQIKTTEQGVIIEENEITKRSVTVKQNDTIVQNNTTEQTATMELYDTTEQNGTTEQNYTIDKSVSMKQIEMTEQSFTIEKCPTYSCQACQKQFLEQAKMDEHSKWHSELEHQYPNPYVRLDLVDLCTCEICKNGYMEHIAVKQQYSSSSCKACSIIVSTLQQADLDECIWHWNKLQLAQHFRNPYVKLDRVKLYTCNVCQNGYLNYNALKQHQNICVATFMKEYYSSRSSENNNNQFKPYKYVSYDRTFVMSSTLEAHAILHKPFSHVCDCGVGYYKKCDLHRHQRLVHHAAPKKPTVPRVKIEVVNKPKTQKKHWEFKDSDDNQEDYKASRKTVRALKATLTYRQSNKSQTKTKRSIKKNKAHVIINQNDAGRYECPVCCKTFSSASTARVHSYIHTGRPYKCDKCSKAFLTKSNLKCHQDWHAGIKRATCEVCNKKFASNNNLKTHMVIHTKERPYPCEVCNKRFTQSSALSLHLLQHTGKKDYVCDVCSKRFYADEAMVRHRRVHTGEKPYTCKDCGKAFSDPSARRRHEMIHTGMKPYCCTQCPQAFADPAALYRHKRRHDGYTATCNLCHKTFSGRESLRTHLKVKHDKTGQKYECDHCGKYFKIKPYLVNHMVTHNPEYLPCDICSKPIRKTCLKTHIMHVHFKNFKFECEICGHKFVQRCDMVKHVNRVHNKTKEPNYECDYCHQRFVVKMYVRKHIVDKHLGIRCESCNRKFGSNFNLRRHKIEGCVRCPVCCLTFTTKLRMEEHFNVHHVHESKRQMYNCTLCIKQYPCQPNLTRHIKSVHGTLEFSCDHCTTRVINRNAIRDHIWEKHMIALYCDICLKRFYSDAEFSNHKRISCGTQEVSCEICEKVLIDKSRLRMHLLSHGAKLECDTCGKRYKKKSEIRRHMRTAKHSHCP